jgi:hypothetical protein
MKRLVLLIVTIFLQGCSVFGVRTGEMLDYHLGLGIVKTRFGGTRHPERVSGRCKKMACAYVFNSDF